MVHCGADIEGGYLYTLTLTDVATGWTECLPLLHRREVLVLAALQRAPTLFPFPILGIDTDNGGEFINESVIAYCEQAHISFTQGRPYLKNDQCFVEQKNGAIVRQVVGYDRLVGEHAYRQLTELYRALRLYVNCFQPSMKLLSKQRDGKKVRFEGEWEQILSWLVANPKRSSGDIFRELQRLSPGRYQPIQIRTLQRGMRKIRVYLLESAEEQWQEEMIHGPSPAPSSPAERTARSS